MTIQQIAQLAINAQNAVNLSGLVLSWASWQTTIRAHANSVGIAPNLHPVNVIMADKVRDLTLNFNALVYSDAYTACQELALV